MLTNNDCSRSWLAMLVLMTAGLVLYSQTLHVPWLFDDYRNIVSNVNLKSLDVFFESAGISRWFTNLTFALNYQVGELSLPGYHLVNIAIHLFNSVLALFLARRLPWKHQWLPLMVAMVFLAHPLQTQAVNYVVQRATLLSTGFCLLSVLCYVSGLRSLHHRSTRNKLYLLGAYSGALCSYLLALLCKENAALLPFVLAAGHLLLLDDGSKIRGSGKKTLLMLAPFFFILVAGVVYQFVFLGIDLEKAGMASRFYAYTDGQIHVVEGRDELQPRYFFTQLIVFWKYILLFLLPASQVFDPCLPLVEKGLPLGSLLGGSAIVASVVVAFLLRRRSPLVWFGLLWIVASLAVESTFIPLDPMYEHRMYLPMFGYVVLFLGLLDAYVPGRLLAAGLCLILVVLFALTWQRNLVWARPPALLVDNVDKVPHSERPRLNLADYYESTGNYEAMLPLLESAVALNPREYRAYLGLGVAHFELGNFGQSFNWFEKLKRLKPIDNAPEYYSGLYSFRRGLYADAIVYMQAAAEKDPRDVKPVFYLAKAFLAMKQDLRAAELLLRIAHARYAGGEKYQSEVDDLLDQIRHRYRPQAEGLAAQVKRQPQDLASRTKYASLMSRLGLYEEAVEVYRDYMDGMPPTWEAHFNLANIYMQSKNYDQAEKQLLAAASLNQGSAMIDNNLGAFYAETGKFPLAIKYFKKAAAKDAENFDAAFNLAKAYYHLHKTDQAMDAFQEAMQRFPEKSNVLQPFLMQLRMEKEASLK